MATFKEWWRIYKNTNIELVEWELDLIEPIAHSAWDMAWEEARKDKAKMTEAEEIRQANKLADKYDWWRGDDLWERR